MVHCNTKNKHVRCTRKKSHLWESASATIITSIIHVVKSCWGLKPIWLSSASIDCWNRTWSFIVWKSRATVCSVRFNNVFPSISCSSKHRRRKQLKSVGADSGTSSWKERRRHQLPPHEYVFCGIITRAKNFLARIKYSTLIMKNLMGVEAINF